jgi:hypothetical protein
MLSDLASVMWKETSEFIGSGRSLRVFAIAVVLMGILPTITLRHTAGGATEGLRLIVGAAYDLFAAVIVVANTAPDLVLHERVGRTLDYLLATRLPDAAIFLGKVFMAAVVGYLAALVATRLQLAFNALLSGNGWSWLYLGDAAGRILVFALPAALVLYVAVVGTFVALRVGDQRSAYLVTVLSLGVLIVPFLLGWLQIALTAAWFGHAAAVLGVFALVLAALGVVLFKRELLILYLQE